MESMGLSEAPGQFRTPGPPSVTARRIAGFWRRTGAFIIDIFILALAGILLGSFAFDTLARLGPWGRLLGFFIAAGYFAVLNSSLAHGQTLGKRLLGIEVVNKMGKNISPVRSLSRFCVLGVPYFLNNAQLPELTNNEPAILVASFLVFGLGSAILYFYVFNRQTRQSLHDLATGTYVVHTYRQGPVIVGDVWKLHYVIATMFCVVALAAAPYLNLVVSKNETLKSLIAVERGIKGTGKVHYASACVGRSWLYTRGKKWEISYVKVDATLKDRPQDSEETAKELVAIVLARYPKIKEKNVVSVVLRYGYDIGIAQSWSISFYSHKAGEWQKILHTTTL